MIKQYFLDYEAMTNDFTIGLGSRHAIEYHDAHDEQDFRVTLADTGQETMTGGRLRRIASHVAGEEAFCMTYGDGVSDVDIAATVAFHRAHGRLATLTAVRPPGRYGALGLAGDAVRSFVEKPDDGGWINGGFFVLDPRALDYVDGDATVWEEEPLRRLAAEGQLAAYRHAGFWRAMDTARDRNALEALWAGGAAPWKLW
jgi:glucose-1-phosphate cytidylyltransferase